MKSTRIAGIDPGLVHTGVVSLDFQADACMLSVRHAAILGPDGEEAAECLKDWSVLPALTWIEDFRDRGNLNSNKAMHNAVSMIAKSTRGKVLNNTGIKKVVTNDLLRLLGCWSFSTVTNHQDLRSAARIALLGYIKTDEGNRMLADLVRDHLDGRTWSVVHH